MTWHHSDLHRCRQKWISWKISTWRFSDSRCNAFDKDIELCGSKMQCPSRVCVCVWCGGRVVYGLYLGDIFPTVVTNSLGLAFATYYCAVFAWALESPSQKAEAYNMFGVTILIIWSVGRCVFSLFLLFFFFSCEIGLIIYTYVISSIVCSCCRSVRVSALLFSWLCMGCSCMWRYIEEVRPISRNVPSTNSAGTCWNDLWDASVGSWVSFI